MSGTAKPMVTEKVCGQRARMTPNVMKIIDILNPMDEVLKITLGAVVTTKSRGEVKVKILEEQSAGTQLAHRTGILLKVRDVTGIQDIHISTHEVLHTRLAIARALRNKSIAISFNP